MLAVNVIEPARIEEVTPERLVALAEEILDTAAGLGRELADQARAERRAAACLADVYHSNRIEGHDLAPRLALDAMNECWSGDPGIRVLQQEAVSLMRLRSTIDEAADTGTLADPATPSFIRRLHRDFCAGLPGAFLEIRDRDGALRERLVPGDLRSVDVTVGAHIAPGFETVPALLDHFAMRYGRQAMGPVARVLAIPAAHHRLLFIHPFPDGNGRVARLMSHAMCHRAGIGVGGLWSLSRGLDRADYAERLAMADARRAGATDGRGVRSLSALAGFTEWFLEVVRAELNHATGSIAPY